jgi:hypothetical protein
MALGDLEVKGILKVVGTTEMTGSIDLNGGALDTALVTNLNADLLDSAHKDTDGTLSGNSDSSIPTEKAVKTYVDTADALKANDNAVVKLTGDQTVAGIKTLSSIPVLPASNPTTDNQAARKAYVDTAASVVHTTGAETIAGEKTLSDGIKIGEAGVVLKTKILTLSYSSASYCLVNHGLTYTKIRGVCAAVWQNSGGAASIQYISVSDTQVGIYLNTTYTASGYAIVFYVP